MPDVISLQVTVAPPPDAHGPIWHFLYDWQTILAGLIGLCIAAIAALIARGQLIAQKEQIALAREQMQISERNSDKERLVEWTLIKEDLSSLLDTASIALGRYPEDGSWTDGWKSAVHALGDIAVGTGRFLDEVIGHARTLNFHQRETIRALRDRVGIFVTFYDDVFGAPYDDDPLDERTWPGVIKPLIDAAGASLAAFSCPPPSRDGVA